MFGIGIGEMVVLLMVIGLVGGGVYLVARTLSGLGAGARAREMEAAKRDLEREIKSMNGGKRLP